MMSEKLSEFIEAMAEAHHDAVEALTQEQLSEALRQALESGDFERLVTVDEDKQAVVYAPYAALSRVRRENEDLRNAIETVACASCKTDIAAHILAD
jgi:hypothetical protein